MASGDTLIILTALNNSPPATSYATLDTRNSHPVLDFDAAADENALFDVFMPRNYDGGGVTITLVWMASTAEVNEVRWETSFERHQDDIDDLDSDSFATEQIVEATCASASGEPAYDTITHTDGAQMDSVAEGESFRLRLRRNADHANDDMAGDAELLKIEIKET
jgi:hypothetical protein